MSAPDGELGARSPTLTLGTRGPLFDCQRALWDRLELAFPARQFDRQVISARPSAATWKRILVRPPMVGVCWLGLTPDERSGRTLRCKSDWLIFVAVRNPKAEGQLTGDSYGPGMLGMVGLACALLHDWSVSDLGIWSIKSVSNSALQEVVDEDVGLVTIEASCALSVVDTEAAAALPEFLSIGAEWDLPPLGGDITDVRQAA